ncbi:hypothetical protein Y032_0013g2112 [Ancylostoma ceylanicum]|uniref:ABC transmembrane type-1 domain-containing protein n=1 Tax=Ancylostoma ceylanicum TaxID=53326 RepID=A0A016VBZ5_9BILA|nr:hypothetical protein Y032_0013g2112 [Ancylostoma ceylanicum]
MRSRHLDSNSHLPVRSVVCCGRPSDTGYSLPTMLHMFKSQDVEAIDTTLPGSIRSMVMTVFNVVATIVVIVIATPLIALPFALLAALYFVVLVRTQLTNYVL